MTDVDAAIGVALTGATQWLDNELRTSFDNTALTDTYFVRRSTGNPAVNAWGTSSDWPVFRTRFYLTRGMVASNSSPLIKFTSKLSNFNVTGTPSVHTIGASSSHDYALTDYVIYDYERGLFNIVDIDLANYYVRITYEAGFETDTVDTAQYKASQVPSWLTEAAELRAIISLEANPILRTEAREQGELSYIHEAVSMLINPHIRYEPYSLRPITTEGSLYTLDTTTAASGESLSRVSGTVWQSAYTPTNSPIVVWGNMVLDKVAALTASNQYTLSGDTFTFYDDLGTTAPTVWYEY